MPEKFTFPTIQQAISLEKAQTMEDIKVSLRNWFNQNPYLKISQNVAWSFKISKGQQSIRRYLHCKFCTAKLLYIKQNIVTHDKITSTYKLSKFSLHHDHRFIESVRQKGKIKTFPQHYSNLPEFSKHSIERERKKRSEKLRKKRQEYYKYKKIQLYYRLGLMVKDEDKDHINVKEQTAKTLGMTMQRFMNFLNSNARATIEVSAIKKLIQKAGFEKYYIQIQNANSSKQSMIKIEDNQVLKDQNIEKQLAQKLKSKSKDFVLEESKQFFKNLMIFVNYNRITKRNLQKSQGLINITHLQTKILSKKFMSNIKWNCLLIYGHDENFFPNQLYAIIMIDSSRFTIKQIKKSFEITFKLLDPTKTLEFKCCIHQQNICIMGALDLIIDQMDRKKNSQQDKSYFSLNYFLSPKLSTNIINKCEFVPKKFRKKLIQKIYQLDPRQVDIQFQKIITELQKPFQIQQYKQKTEEYLGELKSFSENCHKIFLGKIQNPSFLSLIFTNFKRSTENFETSMDQMLSKKLSEYSEGSKYFLEFLIMIFDAFKVPGGSFIYDRQQREIRQSTKIQQIYTNQLVLPQYEYFDQIKRFYNLRAFRGKYEKPKNPEMKILTADYLDKFSAIIYERLYKIRQIYMKTTPEVMTVLIRQIQKSFTLQVQTKTINEIKASGAIKVKEISKQPNTIKIVNMKKFWPSEKDFIPSNAKFIDLAEPPKTIVADVESEKVGIQKQKQKIQAKKIWQCDCNFSKFSFLPCSHQIRCCLTFFTSIEDQVNDCWLFDPKILYQMEEDENKSEPDDSEKENSEKQNNSESD